MFVIQGLGKQKFSVKLLILIKKIIHEFQVLHVFIKLARFYCWKGTITSARFT